MGGGSWTKSEYTTYCSTAGYSVDSNTGRMLSGDISAKQMFKQNSINSSLNPFNVIRECCDTEEHPNTIPVILALDVTGSMGSAAMEVAKALNPIMTDLYDSVKDIEFMRKYVEGGKLKITETNAEYLLEQNPNIFQGINLELVDEDDDDYFEES